MSSYKNCSCSVFSATNFIFISSLTGQLLDYNCNMKLLGIRTLNHLAHVLLFFSKFKNLSYISDGKRILDSLRDIYIACP